jgi:hypothetical protein
MRNPYMMWLITLALSVVLTGCAAINNGSPAAKTAIQAATLKVIGGDPDRAQRVHELAGEVPALMDGAAGDATTMDAVEKRVREEIQWQYLDQAEQLVASNLVDAVRAEIEARIEGGSLDPDDRVAVRTVMQWIRKAAAMAGGGNVAATEAAAGAPAVRHGRAFGAPPGHALRA